MKKIVKILILSTILLSSGCKKKSSKNYFEGPGEEFETYLKEFNKSTSIESKYDSYLKINEEIKNVEKKKDDIQVKSYEFKTSYNKESKALHDTYVKFNYEFYKAIKASLSDSSFKDYFISKEGIEEANFISNLDVESSTYLLSVQEISKEELDNYYSEAQNSHSAKKYNLCFEYIYKLEEGIEKILNNYYIAYVNYTLDSRSVEYMNLYSESANLYEIYLNKFYEILKIVLKDNNTKDLAIKEFEIDEEMVDYILNKDIVSDEMLALFEQENELVASYASTTKVEDLKKLYVDLIQIRKQIAEKSGYDNYLEYAYDNFQRDYTVEEAHQLCLNIMNKSELNRSFVELIQNEDNKYYNQLLLSRTKLTESEIFSYLSNVEEVFEGAKNVARTMKVLGYYNYEVRKNKVQTSFVSGYGNSYFMEIYRSGYIIDIDTIFHEFGHYLGNTQFDIDNVKGVSLSLDVAEMDSQALEYIMTDYYTSFLNENIAKSLNNYICANALWAIESSVLVSELEYYAYTEDNITISSLDDAFYSIVQNTTYPYSFGIDDNKPIYTPVIHLYQQPGYYISYLTSIIPALQIFASNNAIPLYNKLIDYSPYNGFKDTISYLGLSSPFEANTIDIVYDKILNSIK